ncbi:MAG: NAD(P)(+) transhydrogenase (Re/Si-specific) subunit beta [Christensenellales bacterium]|jgi:NAD(P) transhydrogenase subunit beta
MSDTLYYIFSILLSLGVLYGIRLMSKVETAARGNRVSALCMFAAVVITLLRTDLTGSLPYITAGLIGGSLISLLMTVRTKMIQMPQVVGLLNGLGGLASMLAALLTVSAGAARSAFELITSALALAVGALTFSGSMVAAGKLHGKLAQIPLVYPGHGALTAFAVLVMIALIVLLPLNVQGNSLLLCLLLILVSLIFGWLFAIRVGGADMPITISLLNSTSGVAAAIAGMALGDILLVAVGGIVGASGLLLTQIMCRSMNRRLSSVIFGSPSHQAAIPAKEPLTQESKNWTNAQQDISTRAEEKPTAGACEDKTSTADTAASPAPADAPAWLDKAQSVIIIPGYGMAISQAQEKVKQLLDALQAAGKQVRFAIHPVAGRMPGHMNVLLAEVDIPYELLCEMEDINQDFPSTDLAIVIGANDVVNPAANTAQGTPIYGMPILNVSQAKQIIICNYDKKPGYAGVDNPLYEQRGNVLLLLGDAKDSLDILLSKE